MSGARRYTTDPRETGSDRSTLCARAVHGRGSPVIALIAVAMSVLVGCAGRASVHMVPLSAKKISMTHPLVVRVDPDQCYFFVSDNNELCIAMRHSKGAMLGKRREREFILSLVLDSPPAGPARQYKIGQRAMRARTRAGYAHTRSASLRGNAVIWDYGKTKLRGRFRLAAKQQSYSVLAGWKGDHQVLFVGEFVAVHDRKKSEAILTRTEQDGMTRPPARAKPIPINGPPREIPKASTRPRDNTNGSTDQ